MPLHFRSVYLWRGCLSLVHGMFAHWASFLEVRVACILVLLLSLAHIVQHILCKSLRESPTQESSSNSI